MAAECGGMSQFRCQGIPVLILGRAHVAGCDVEEGVLCGQGSMFGWQTVCLHK